MLSQLLAESMNNMFLGILEMLLRCKPFCMSMPTGWFVLHGKLTSACILEANHMLCKWSVFIILQLCPRHW